MFIYRVYLILTTLLHFVLPFLLKSRIKKGKENPKRYKEKLGIYTLSRPQGKLIWFHAASVGEFNSLIPVINRIKDAKVLVTTVTLTSSQMFEKAKLKNTIHQFAPLDSPLIVKKFLDHWSPNIGIFVDSEIWPNLLRMSSQRIKLINLNARLSPKSAKRWEMCKPFITFLYNSFDAIYPCSTQDLLRISNLTNHKHIEYIGNLKYAGDAPSCDEKLLSKYQSKLDGRTVIVAASTHPGEEDFIISALKSTLETHPEILLIIAPRSPYRSLEIRNIAHHHHIKSATRSEEDDIASAQIYIADTIGEMGLWYRLSSIVLMGGTFLTDGHNIIEPAKLNNAIIVGNSYPHFEDVINEFHDNHAIKIIHSKEELNTQIIDLIKSPKLVEKLSQKALESCKQDSILKKIDSIIKV